ncbi:MAG: heme o synthase [Bacteroidetes bacterium]|nr:heme o synthase [Bacteroidota bacterium]
MKDIAALFKVRLGFFVVMSAILGWFMAVDSLDLNSFLLLTIGGYLLTGASNGLNQIIEQRVDGLMDRTAERPLPSGRMAPWQAWTYSLIAAVLGLGSLFWLNPLSGWLGLAALISYAFVYTPLKSRSTLSVFIGAFPGALPPMIGYVAATGDFGIEPGTLFAVQFMWQFPHFWAIAWLAHDDYQKAGYHMLPFRTGRTRESAWQILLYTAFCIPASLLPWALPTGNPMVGNVALVVAIVFGLLFLIPAWKLHRTLDAKYARRLMFTSFAYLPAVQLAYVLDKI